jgi:hypothetical protein
VFHSPLEPLTKLFELRVPSSQSRRWDFVVPFAIRCTTKPAELLQIQSDARDPELNMFFPDSRSTLVVRGPSRSDKNRAIPDIDDAKQADETVSKRKATSLFHAIRH